MADKKVNITVEADTSGAVKHIEELYGALADVNNVMKPISTLAKEAGQGLDAIAKSKEATPAQQNAIKDLVPVLQILKDSTSLATGEMKGLEKSIKNVASARDVLARYSKTGSSLFGSVSNMGDDWSREYEKALKAQLPHVDTKESIAIKNANAVLDRSLLSLGSGYDDTSAAYGKKAIYYQQATKNIGELQKAMKAVIDSGKGSDEIVGKLNNRINDLSKVSAKAGNSIGNTWKRMKSNIIAFSTTMVFGKALHLLLSTIPSLFAKASKAASDATEANNLYVQTFDRIPNIAEEASGRVRKTFALSESTAKNAIGTFAQYMVGLGKSQSEAAAFAEKATKVFLDIRSFKNIGGDLETFLQKAMSGLAGHTENFRTMGLAINATAAQERLMSKGLGDLTGNAKRAAIAQEYLNMVVEQAQDAMGDFSRNYYTMQNTTQRLSEQTKQWAENTGKAINNWFTPFKSFIADLIELKNTAKAAADEADKLTGTLPNQENPDAQKILISKINTAYSAAYEKAIQSINKKYRKERRSNNGTFEERELEGARIAWTAVAKSLNVSATEAALLTGRYESLDIAHREILWAIDYEINQEKERESAIEKNTEGLSHAKKYLEDINNLNESIANSKWQDTLTAVQRSTGDYDQATVEKTWIDSLKTQYNQIASMVAEIFSAMSSFDPDSEVYKTYSSAINMATLSLNTLEEKIKAAGGEIDGLSKAAKESQEALRKGMDFSELVRASNDAKTGQSYADSANQYITGLKEGNARSYYERKWKDDPYKDARLARYDATQELYKNMSAWEKQGLDVGPLAEEATKAINDAFDNSVKETDEALKKNIGTYSWSQLEEIRNNQAYSETAREMAKNTQKANLANYAKDSAMSLADSATGGILSAGMKGFASGGPIGAVIGAVVALIQKLEIFKKVCEPIELLVGAINDSLSPFEPMIDMLNQSLSALFKALLPISPVTRILSSALTGFGYVIGSVANIIKTAYELTSGIVKDVFNGIRRSAGAIGSFLKHLVNPFKWNKLAGDIDDMKKAWSFSETGEALSNWKDTQKNLYEQLKDTNKAIWSIEESSSTTAKNTAKDNSKLQAWKELMDAGYLTGAQFSAMSRNYNGVGYKFGSPSLNASNFGAVAGAGRTATIGQVTIKIEGSGDPEAVARAVERILRNRAVYGVSA